MAKQDSTLSLGVVQRQARAFGLPFFFVSALTLLILAVPLRGDDPETRVNKIKCAYILNFIKFTEWPAESFEKEDSPIRFTVVGPAKTTLLESTLDGAEIGGRKIIMRRVLYPEPDAWSDEPNPEALKAFYAVLRQSHVVVINSQEARHVRPILAQLQGLNILTISTVPRFAEQGGMLGLVPRDNRIVFDANVDAIERTAIKVSSKVLRLAKIVKTEGE